MDLPVNDIVGYIAASTTTYVAEFSPVFILMAGIVLAVGLMQWLVLIIRGEPPIVQDKGDGLN